MYWPVTDPYDFCFWIRVQYRYELTDADQKCIAAARDLWTAAFCPNPPTPTVTDKNVRQAPSMSEPAPRTPYIDPVFGTCVVRVTDRTHDIAADDRSKGLKNEYSTVQSFNADETKLIALALEGTWYLYDAHTLQPLGRTAPHRLRCAVGCNGSKHCLLLFWGCPLFLGL